MAETTATKQEPIATDADANVATQLDERKSEFASTGRLRDEKGHFLPNPDKPCQHDKKPKRTRKQKEDENTVKIRIVKDEVEPPERDFASRLEDIKERTATNFIKSICFHKPRVISIDGMKYYSEEAMEELVKKYEEAKAAAYKAIETTEYAVDTLVKTGAALDDCYKSAQKGFVWWSIAIVLFAAIVSFSVVMAIEKRNSAKAKEAAPIEQTQTMQGLIMPLSAVNAATPSEQAKTIENPAIKK